MAPHFNVAVSVRRFQFSLRALLVAMLVVAAFFGGMVIQKRLDRPMHRDLPSDSIETMTLRDGTTWLRVYQEAPRKWTVNRPAQRVADD